MMKKPQIKRDSEKFYVDTSEGRLSGDEIGDLQELAMEIEQNTPRPPKEFLAAWKDGAQHDFPFPTLVDIATLDVQRRAVIAQLLESYSGW